MRKLLTLSGAWLLCLVSAPAQAQEDMPQSPLFDALRKCRGQGDETTRLRCYDIAVGALTDASTRGEVVVVTREDVRRTRRSLFGFSLPKLPFFGGDNSQEGQPDEIQAVIKSFRMSGPGRYVLGFEDGSTWQTTDGRSIRPRVGDTVTIKRAALGSYFLRVGGRSVKAMRIK